MCFWYGLNLKCTYVLKVGTMTEGDELSGDLNADELPSAAALQSKMITTINNWEMTEHLSACVYIQMCSIVMNHGQICNTHTYTHTNTHTHTHTDTQTHTHTGKSGQTCVSQHPSLKSTMFSSGLREDIMFSVKLTVCPTGKGVKLNSGSRSGPKPNSPFHQGLLWVLGDLLVLLGQWVPVEETSTALKQP